jgi:hypothetical protein
VYVRTIFLHPFMNVQFRNGKENFLLAAKVVRLHNKSRTNPILILSFCLNE